jgi:hypothetical protein
MLEMSADTLFETGNEPKRALLDARQKACSCAGREQIGLVPEKFVESLPLTPNRK